MSIFCLWKRLMSAFRISAFLYWKNCVAAFNKYFKELVINIWKIIWIIFAGFRNFCYLCKVNERGFRHKS